MQSLSSAPALKFINLEIWNALTENVFDSCEASFALKSVVMRPIETLTLFSSGTCPSLFRRHPAAVSITNPELNGFISVPPQRYLKGAEEWSRINMAACHGQYVVDSESLSLPQSKMGFSVTNVVRNFDKFWILLTQPKLRTDIAWKRSKMLLRCPIPLLVTFHGTAGPVTILSQAETCI